MRSPTTISVPPTLLLEGSEATHLNDSNILALQGPRVRVQIERPLNYKRLHTLQGIRIDEIVGSCMIDTGAFATQIDTRIAEKLDLLKIDTAEVSSSIGGADTRDIHPVELILLGYTFILHQAISTNLQQHGLIALIGRDILSLGNLHYFGTQGEFCFEIPGLVPDNSSFPK